ncbi:unnamed protein product, partial [Dibothriocephalus latus]
MEVAYWKCANSLPPRDTIYFLTAFVSSASLLLSISLLIVLCILTGKTKTYLIHMRALTASTVLCSFIGFCNHVIPPRFTPNDYIFGRVVCHVWSSRYLFDASYIFGALNLNFMVGNRAIQIVGKYQNAFAPSMFSDLTYLIIIGLSSVLSILCQAFVVEWNGRFCFCRETGMPYMVLVAAYVGTFVRFGLTVIISPVILCVSCYKIVQWVRNTPAADLTDTWNGLALPGSTEQQVVQLLRPRGWMTASMCIVPLSANFVAFS